MSQEQSSWVGMDKESSEKLIKKKKKSDQCWSIDSRSNNVLRRFIPITSISKKIGFQKKVKVACDVSKQRFFQSKRFW